MPKYLIRIILTACFFVLIPGRAFAFDTHIYSTISSDVVNIGDEFRLSVTIHNDYSGETAYSPRVQAIGLDAFTITSASSASLPNTCGFSNSIYGHSAYCTKSSLGPGENFTMTVVMTAAGPTGDYTIFTNSQPTGTDNTNDQQALVVRVNTPPVASISSPLDESRFASGSIVNLSADASDAEDGDLSSQISWWSNLSGSLGTGAAPAISLIDGRHTITANIVDSNGVAGSDAIQVNVGALSPLPATIQTIAGTGVSGYTGDGGPAEAATFNYISSSTRTPQGEIFIIDGGNDAIRKIDTQGDISTILSGQLYRNLAFITHDSSGNIYWYNLDAAAIYKRDTGGTVSKIAGGCCTPREGMRALDVYLNSVGDFVISPQGEIYFSASSRNQVFRIDADGIIHLVAGNGASYPNPVFGQLATTQPVNFPLKLAVDSVGNVYISEYGVFNRILKVDTSGILTLYAGSSSSESGGDLGPATLATLGYTQKLLINENDELLINESNRIRKVDSAGIINTIYGNGIDEISGDGGFAVEAGIGGLKSIELLGTDELLLSHWFKLRKISTTPLDVNLGITGTGSTLIQQGDNAITSFIISNNSDYPVENIFVDFASADSLTISGTPSALCSPASSNIRCRIQSLNAGETTTINLSLPGINFGLHSITGTVSSYYNDLTPLDNEALFQYTVNTPSSLTIVSPADTGVYSDDPGSITLTAIALDAEDGDLSSQIQWYSSLDGAIVSPASLTVGSHQITASVTDSGGQLTTAVVNIDVLAATLDNDNDEIPNGWEIANGLNPLDAADATDNPDGDALNNIQEYRSNSNPNLLDNIYGDINHDGLLNVVDLLLMQRHIFSLVTLDEFSVARGDLYPAGAGDGNLTLSDMILLINLIN